MLPKKVIEVYSKMQQIFCEPNTPKDDPIRAHKEREECFTWMNYAILQIIIKTGCLITSTIPISFYIIAMSTMSGTLFFLYKKKLWIMKIAYFCVCTFLPTIDTLMDPNQALLVSPIVGSMLTIWCLLATRSPLTGVLSFLVNSLSTLYFSKPQITEHLYKGSKLEIEIFVSKLVITSINCNECACVLFLVLTASNNLLMSRLVNEAENLKKTNSK